LWFNGNNKIIVNFAKDKIDVCNRDGVLMVANIALSSVDSTVWC